MRFSGLLLLPFVLAGISFCQSTNFSVGPQYLITTESAQFLRPIATPSLSLNATLPPSSTLPQIGPAVTNPPYVANPELEHQANLFPIYYGYPEIPAVELTSSQPSELPPSVNDTGFVNVPAAQWLRVHGYGVTLAEAAAYSRAHKRASSHVYTNEDIQRLHQK